jgi:hypothetical protein
MWTRDAGSSRYLALRIGDQIEMTVRAPIPKSPKPKDQNWTEWQANGKYQIRFRVQDEDEFQQQRHAPEVEFEAARAKSLAAITADVKIEDWLPFFEDRSQQSRQYDWQDKTSPELVFVSAHVRDLARPLESKDLDTVRRALYATAVVRRGLREELPEELIRPLADAGRMTLPLLAQAQAQDLPGDPDVLGDQKAWSFFSAWEAAAKRVPNGGLSNAACRLVLEEIHRVAERRHTGSTAMVLIEEHSREALGGGRTGSTIR